MATEESTTTTTTPTPTPLNTTCTTNTPPIPLQPPITSIQEDVSITKENEVINVESKAQMIPQNDSPNNNNNNNNTQHSLIANANNNNNPNDKDCRKSKSRRIALTPSHKLLALHHKPFDELSQSDINRYLCDVPHDVLIECLTHICLQNDKVFHELDRYALSDPTKTRIFIRGLNYNTTKETLSKHFEKFGQVIDATVIYDKANNRSKGYGFITFGTSLEAAGACKEGTLNVDGRSTQISLATPLRHRHGSSNATTDRPHTRDRVSSNNSVSDRDHRSNQSQKRNRSRSRSRSRDRDNRRFRSDNNNNGNNRRHRSRNNGDRNGRSHDKRRNGRFNNNNRNGRRSGRNNNNNSTTHTSHNYRVPTTQTPTPTATLYGGFAAAGYPGYDPATYGHWLNPTTATVAATAQPQFATFNYNPYFPNAK